MCQTEKPRFSGEFKNHPAQLLLEPAGRAQNLRAAKICHGIVTFV
jgi:hypothetical protein